MWLINAAKTAKEKASIIVATVQDEAQMVLDGLAYSKYDPIEEPVFEEKEAFEIFIKTFNLSNKTDEIAQIMAEDPYISKLHSEVVPVKLSYEEFWTRFFFRSEGPFFQNKKKNKIINSPKNKENLNMNIDNNNNDNKKNELNPIEKKSTNNEIQQNEINKKQSTSLSNDNNTHNENDNMTKIMEDLQNWKIRAHKFRKLVTEMELERENYKKNEEETKQQQDQIISSLNDRIMELEKNICDAKNEGFEEGLKAIESSKINDGNKKNLTESSSHDHLLHENKSLMNRINELEMDCKNNFESGKTEGMKEKEELMLKEVNAAYERAKLEVIQEYEINDKKKQKDMKLKYEEEKNNIVLKLKKEHEKNEYEMKSKINELNDIINKNVNNENNENQVKLKEIENALKIEKEKVIAATQEISLLKIELEREREKVKETVKDINIISSQVNIPKMNELDDFTSVIKTEDYKDNIDHSIKPTGTNLDDWGQWD